VHLHLRRDPAADEAVRPVGAHPATLCRETVGGDALAAEFRTTSRQWRPTLHGYVDRLPTLSEEELLDTAAMAIYVYMRVAASPWSTLDEHFQKSACEYECDRRDKAEHGPFCQAIGNRNQAAQNRAMRNIDPSVPPRRRFRACNCLLRRVRY